MGLSFGADPEFVVMDQHGTAVSAIKALKGHGKDNKLKIGNQAIFYDNVLLEMNLRPAKTFSEFSMNFLEALQGANHLLGKKNYHLEALASLEYPKSEIEDVDACIFGCEPEFCIYTTNPDGTPMRVEPPINIEGNSFRSAGGHIHIGHVIANLEYGGKPEQVIKMMDGLIGIVSVLLDRDPSSSARRKLYGGAGQFRVTDYGVEYRTPSNYWLRDPNLANLIYKLTRLAVELVMTTPNFVDDLIDGASLRNIINSSDEHSAEQLFGAYKHRLPYELHVAIENWRSASTAINKSLTGWLALAKTQNVAVA